MDKSHRHDLGGENPDVREKMSDVRMVGPWVGETQHGAPGHGNVLTLDEGACAPMVLCTFLQVQFSLIQFTVEVKKQTCFLGN